MTIPKNNLPAKTFEDVAVQINEQVDTVIKSSAHGFKMAFVKATAIEKIKGLLSKEYMEPIMGLQGTKIGFKTDKDNSNGYPVEVVKNCLIEATLMGVEPTGNQFNIIAGNTYITKEGYGHLLSKVPGLNYEIVPGLPRINQQKDGAAIEMTVRWSINAETPQERKLDIPVKMNSFMGTDGVIGKATRKARAWLYNTITGSELPEGDASEMDAAKTVPIQATDVPKEEKDRERKRGLIKACKTVKELEDCLHFVTEDVRDDYDKRMYELTVGKSNQQNTLV